MLISQRDRGKTIIKFLSLCSDAAGAALLGLFGVIFIECALLSGHSLTLQTNQHGEWLIEAILFPLIAIVNIIRFINRLKKVGEK
jgi:hypothetical protein